MKELRGQASGAVAAPVEQCLALLRTLDHYPSWYPDRVRNVDVLERDHEGRPVTVRAVLHVVLGPLVKDFELTLAVKDDPGNAVKFSRLPNEPSDSETFEVTWQVERVEQEDTTRIDLRLDAVLDVPRLLPVGGIGDSIAGGFLEAASRTLDPR